MYSFWHTKVRALRDIKDWSNLLAFANEKKSPIGYLPFANACIKQGAYDQAAIYIAKLTDQKEKTALLIQIRRWREAAEIALKCGEIDLINTIYRLCNDPELKKSIEKQMA